MKEQRTAAGPARPVGRPRSEKADKAILEAALDMLGEGMSVAEVSIEAIAARAGVGKTTVYRRWSNKEDLVADALATLKAPVPPLTGRSVREALVTYLRVLRDESGDRRARCLTNLAMCDPERHPRLAERFRMIAVEPWRAAIRGVLHRGIESGELRRDLDVDVALALLSGAMIWYTKWCDTGSLPDDLPERIVDEALAGFRAR